MILNILLVIFAILIFFIYYKYRKQRVQENFAQNYYQDMLKYFDTLKMSNKTKQMEIDKKTKKKTDKYKSMNTMKKEKVLVTGATSGIGYFIAKYISNTYKCKIFITGKDKEKVKKVQEELLQNNPSNVFSFATDFRKKKSIDKLFDSVKKQMKNVSILINATNITKGSSLLLDKNESDMKEELVVNFESMVVLSQLITKRMVSYKTNGRIINFSSHKGKNIKYNMNHPDKIITESAIENFSNVLSQELYENKIAITTIRMDEEFNFNKNKRHHIDLSRLMGNSLNDVFYASAKKLKPILDHSLRAPFNDITGKILSTDNFNNNKELMNIVSPNKLYNNDRVFKNAYITKTIKRNDQDKTLLLTKQNPYPYSSKVTKFLKSDKVFNKFNTMGKYDSILDTILSKKNKVSKDQIVFFKTEFDALKKIVELFVSKGHDILTTQPVYPFLELAALENKNNISLVTLKNTYNRFLDINYSNFNFGANSKMVYLTSPNNISGLCIRENTKWRLFLEKLEDNIILVIDERYMDFVKKEKVISKENDKILDSIKLVKKRPNTIVLRSFNNFYSIENLELCYIITSEEISDLIKKTQVINPIDHFSEQLALTVLDDKYYINLKEKIAKERIDFQNKLKQNSINYYDSDTNFFLIETFNDKNEIMNDFENEDIVLYSSYDGYNNYWTLPLSTPENNKRILDIILYDKLDEG